MKKRLSINSKEYKDLVNKLLMKQPMFKQNQKDGFTNVKDVDREILMKLPDADLIKACSLNKYLFETVCDEQFFHRRLQAYYPDIVLNYVRRPYDKTWKQYFLEIVYYINKLKEKYNYTYSDGSPEIQYKIFKKSKDNDELLVRAVRKGELEIVQEALKRGVTSEAKEQALFYSYIPQTKRGAANEEKITSLLGDLDGLIN